MILLTAEGGREFVSLRTCEQGWPLVQAAQEHVQQQPDRRCPRLGHRASARVALIYLADYGHHGNQRVLSWDFDDPDLFGRRSKRFERFIGTVHPAAPVSLAWWRSQDAWAATARSTTFATPARAAQHGSCPAPRGVLEIGG
jgi:hypothetical protein